MQLTFENVGMIGTGSFPDFLQYYDTEGQLFYIKSGELYGKPSEKLDGDFTSPTWLDEVKVGVDTNISLLEIKTLNGFGLIGSYKSGDTQKMIIYEFQHDMNRYLKDGSIQHSIDNPITGFSLTLENPRNEFSDRVENVAINENMSLFSPGAKVIFRFSMGDDEEIDMGTFFIDHSDYSVLSEAVQVDGRNLIGKSLRDQTLNDHNVLSFNAISTILENILQYSNLNHDQYSIQYDGSGRSFSFDSDMNVYAAIEEILKTMVTWKMEESLDGRIIIGDSDYGEFQTKSTYSFQRNKDIFSRNIRRDDESAYRKVCVRDRDWNIKIYRDVQSFSGWNLQSNKTLFVEVPEGTSIANATSIADTIALRLESVGKVETFTGPFRPYILIGDGAEIIDGEGTTTLGLITEIIHTFGKSGFTTSFSVDSGGRVGRGRLVDYISMVRGEKTAGSIGYEEIIE